MNHSCADGKVIYRKARDVSTGEGIAQGWTIIEDCEKNDEEALITASTIARITAASAAKRPFFIGLGHHRPHMPWQAPRRFFDALPSIETTAVAAHPELPLGAVTLNWKPWVGHTGSSPGEQTFAHTQLPRRFQQAMRRGYYASIGYMDYHFGLVLEALEASGQAPNTAVISFGDHGWSLGEHNSYEKKTLWENDCRVPLLIRAPFLPGGGRAGERTHTIVEIVAVMPTLIELAGLPPCQENLGGQSFASEIVAAGSLSSAAARYAFSTFPRCNCTYETDVIDVRNGTCPLGPYHGMTGGVGASNMHVCLETSALAFDWMGLSIRSDRWRYTLWMEWDGAALAPRWDRVVGEELYDHAEDDGLGGARIFDAFENLNLASRVANPHPTAVQLSAIKTLRMALQANEASDGAPVLDGIAAVTSATGR